MMNAYRFISEIYRLLGELDPESLRALDRALVSPEIRPIVDAFCATKRQSVSVPVIEDGQEDTARSEGHAVPAIIATPENGASDAIAAVLDRVRNGYTNQQFIQLLTRAGLRVLMRDKESRASVMRKALRELEQLSVDRRERVMHRLVQFAQTGETEGWMNVIRSGKP